MNRTSPHAILSRNAQERPCHSQEGHTGGTAPALQPQEHRVHNTSVAPQGGGQSTTALVADLVTIEVQGRSATYLSREDRTYVPRSCVEHTSDRRRQPCECDDAGCKADRNSYISCRVLLVENCVARDKERSKVVLMCHVMAYVVMLCRSLACGMYTPPQHITTDLRRRASLNSDRDIESIQPSLTRCHRAPQSAHNVHHVVRALSWRKMVFDNRTLFTTEQPWRSTFDGGGWLLGSGEWCSFAPGKVYFNPGEETPLIR